MTTQQLAEINTAVKALSMRREALYRALTHHAPGSDSWAANRREIDSINESMDAMEAERSRICDELLAA